jgi:hypothetical protein
VLTATTLAEVIKLGLDARKLTEDATHRLVDEVQADPHQCNIFITRVSLWARRRPGSSKWRVDEKVCGIVESERYELDSADLSRERAIGDASNLVTLVNGAPAGVVGSISRPDRLQSRQQRVA